MSKPMAIVGAGVSGLTCGVLLAEAGHGVTIFAAETGPDTTSAAAGAIWYPYDAEPAEAVIAWALQTHEVLARLSADPATGVSLVELRTFSRASAIEVPAWASALGARLLAPEEVGLTNGCASGFALTVPLTDTTIYLDYLARRFRDAGGVVRGNTHFQRLEEVPAEFDPIIDCAGIGARELAGDHELEPHRGQVAIVPRMNLPYAVVCDGPPLMYAIPRTTDCLLGGTNEVSFSRAVDASDTTRIVAECSRVLRIGAPPVAGEKVGLRPFRKSGVRVARDRSSDGRLVVHNYGHGGSGFTLSWGCAEDVAKLIHQPLPHPAGGDGL